MEEAQRRLPRFRGDGRDRAAAVVLAAALSISIIADACRRESDEDRVKAVIHRAIDAGNEKKVGDVLAEAAENFKGPHDADVSECRRVLLGYFMQAGWLRTFEQDLQVTIEGTDRARAELDVLIARGNPVTKIEDVLPTNAGRFLFSLELQKIDGAWKFTRASYKQVAISP